MNPNISLRDFKLASDPCGYTVVAPFTSLVSARDDVKFVYVMRRDGASVCEPLADKIAAEYRISQSDILDTINPLYDRFVSGLTHILGRNFARKGKTEIHLFNPEYIDTRRKVHLGQRQAVSLDPLLQGKDIKMIGMSRGYLPGGEMEIGMLPRPGYPSLHEQIHAIKDEAVTQDGIDLFEDDVYTGRSLIRILDMLEKENIKVKRVVPGIQIGSPQVLQDRGIDIRPAIRYDVKPGQEVDLGDPRDFLLGADGLVIVLNGKQLGRLPYIAPFVSPSARLSVPKEHEHEFSRDVLMLNREFFAAVERALYITLDLNHMNDVSASALTTLVPKWKNARMTDMIDDMLKEPAILKSVCESHKDCSAVKVLDLPKKIVFLDVNGTILPAESKDGYIAEEDLKEFRLAVEDLEKTGVAVGLNSDSPLPQLRAMAHTLGMPNAPILAENGAVLSYRDKKIDFRTLKGLDGFKARIQTMAEKCGIPQVDDVVAPEFGGAELAADKWAFGANRTNSLSVFADDKLLRDIKALLDASRGDGAIGYDYSPQHRFLGVHSCENFRQGKAETILKLIREGHEVVSVGDSMSDYVPAFLPNRVVFVQDGLPQDVLREPHVSVSAKKGIAGVIETLKSFASQTSWLERKKAPSYGI